MNLSVLKSATGEPCLECYVALLYFSFFIYISKKQLFTSLRVLVKVSLVFVMINKLNTYQALIQITRLGKVQHTDSAQLSKTDGSSHWRTRRYTFLHILGTKKLLFLLIKAISFYLICLSYQILLSAELLTKYAEQNPTIQHYKSQI